MKALWRTPLFTVFTILCCGSMGLGCHSNKSSSYRVVPSPPVQYSIKPLSVGFSDDSSVSLNNIGDILIINEGQMNKDEVWHNGKEEILQSVLKDSRYRFIHASGMNNQGVVAGNISGDGDGAYLLEFSRVVVWQRRRETELLPDSSSEIVANGINDAGDVIGYTFENSNDMTAETNQAFLYQHGKIINLGRGEALRINNQGQILVKRPEPDRMDDGLYLWELGAERPVNVPHGYQEFDTIHGLNNQGKVIGEVSTTRPSFFYTDRGFVWQSGEMQILGTLGGQFSKALGINNKGQIVGQSDQYDNGETHAFLWQNGRMYDLNNFIPAHSGWVLNSADAINDHGQIVGNGNKGAFLLNPR